MLSGGQKISICYKDFVYYVSKCIGMCGRGMFVLVVCLGVGCVRLSVCIDAGVLEIATHRGSYGGLRKSHCIDGVICVC